MKILTKEMQTQLTSTFALELLKEGNKRFVNNLTVNRNLLEQANEMSDGQHPFVVILSSIDSRTSAELIFDQGMADIINDDILVSMEFACKVAGAKFIVVFGHTQCSAIRGACDPSKIGNLTAYCLRFRLPLRKNQKRKIDVPVMPPSWKTFPRLM